MNIQTIPLNKLVPSPANVRKTGVGTGVEELAASIAAHGLLQNLQVRTGAGGKFEVVAGGRRLAALRLLAKQKTIPKSSPIACNLLDDADAGEISLAENVMRVAMHPADQFDAFKELADEGSEPNDIAARFGTTATNVRQRLKLAAVSPRLMEEYRADRMNLDQLMAFTVSDDCEAQEAVWFGQPEHNLSPRGIRRMLTIEHVEADDRRAVFIGVDAYIAAGGIVTRDLFQPEHEGYLIDLSLVDRLVAEKLQGEAAVVHAEGWAWVDAVTDLEWDRLRRFGHAEPVREALSADITEEIDRLSTEYDELMEEHGDDPVPEIAARLAILAERIDELSASALSWRDEDKVRCGAIVSIDRDGSLLVERGLIRPEDKPRPGPQAADGECGVTKNPAALSDRLIQDLTAHRTAALRAMLAGNPVVALAAVTHTLALSVFYSTQCEARSCLDLRAHSADLRVSAEGIADSPATLRLNAHYDEWVNRLPADASGLWEWLLAQTAETLMALLACCAAFSVTAVRKASDRVNAAHLAHADQMATALCLDMRQWWQPTAESYLGRVSKAHILEAVTEAVSKSAADNLAKLKKNALAKRAEEKLAGTGWLPTILRRTDPAAAEADELATDQAA